MNFSESLAAVASRFDEAGLRYALIGGLAMAMRGVQRATLDADFILLADDLDAADSALHALGYRRDFRSENVSHYITAECDLVRIDLLHAFRPATLGMLERAERLKFTDQQTLPVVHIEDLIGLKVQATVNDPSRHHRDWGDIHLLLDHASRRSIPLDWELLADYLALFSLQAKLAELQHQYGPPQAD